YQAVSKSFILRMHEVLTRDNSQSEDKNHTVKSACGLRRVRRMALDSDWRPRRDLNPCYRRESGMAKRNFNKLQEHGRTGWRSRNSRKHLIVSPMCPRQFSLPTVPCPWFRKLKAQTLASEPGTCWSPLETRTELSAENSQPYSLRSPNHTVIGVPSLSPPRHP